MKKILIIAAIIGIVTVCVTDNKAISIADSAPVASTIGSSLMGKDNNLCTPKQPETASTVAQQKAIVATVAQEQQVEAKIAGAPYYGATTPELQKLIDQYNKQIAAYDTCVLIPAN